MLGSVTWKHDEMFVQELKLLGKLQYSSVLFDYGSETLEGAALALISDGRDGYDS
jgi:hypothetical protein